VADSTNLKLLVAGVMLCLLMGTPSLALAKEEGKSDSHALRIHLANTLKLDTVEEKYDRIRLEALERINKSAEQMDKLLSGEKPDAGKLKALTTAMASDQDILVNTYKGRRDEILAMLTPVQQGVYLSITWNGCSLIL
jgi:hypothetical protein